MATTRIDTANAFETTLTQDMDPTDLTAFVASKGSLSSPCLLVIEPDDDGQREYVLFDGTFGALSFVTLSSGNRNLPGSAESYPMTLKHPSGSVVSSVITQQHLEDLYTWIDTNITNIATNVADIAANVSDIADVVADLVVTDAAFADHKGGTETADHPEVTTSVRGFMAATDLVTLNAAVDRDGDTMTGILIADSPPETGKVSGQGTRNIFTIANAGVKPSGDEGDILIEEGANNGGVYINYGSGWNLMGTFGPVSG